MRDKTIYSAPIFKKFLERKTSRKGQRILKYFQQLNPNLETKSAKNNQSQLMNRSVFTKSAAIS